MADVEVPCEEMKLVADEVGKEKEVDKDDVNENNIDINSGVHV